MATDNLLQQGIAALKSGQKTKARALLEQVLQQDERNEIAWLWLSGAVDSDEERQTCLENVLTINPNNSIARQGLDTIIRKQPARPVSQPKPSEITNFPTVPQQRPIEEPVTSSTESLTFQPQPPPTTKTKLCPFCAEEIQENAIVCRYCGHNLSESPISLPAFASFGQRAIASLIDAAIATTLGIVVSFGCGCSIPFLVLPLVSTSNSNSGSELGAVVYMFLQCVIWIVPYVVIVAYHSFQLSRSGQTIGKRIMKIQVVSNTGKLPTLGQAFGRTLAYSLSELILFIGYFFPLWDEHRQALHDKVAGTYVVKRLGTKNA